MLNCAVAAGRRRGEYGYGAYPAGHAWQSNALTVGLVLTLLGLRALQVVLTESGDSLLARLGTIAYLVGVVLWLVDDALDLAGGGFIFESGPCCISAASAKHHSART
jgi:hypothetical protein